LELYYQTIISSCSNNIFTITMLAIADYMDILSAYNFALSSFYFLTGYNPYATSYIVGLGDTTVTPSVNFFKRSYNDGVGSILPGFTKSSVTDHFLQNFDKYQTTEGVTPVSSDLFYLLSRFHTLEPPPPPPATPLAGELKITEVNSHQTATVSWIEIHNTTSSELSLEGVKIQHYRNLEQTPNTSLSLSGTIESDEYLIITRNIADFTASYSGITPDFELSSMFLNGATDGVAIFHADVSGFIDQINDLPANVNTFDFLDNRLYLRKPDDNSGESLDDWCIAGTYKNGTPGTANIVEWDNEVDGDWSDEDNWDGDYKPCTCVDVLIPGTGITDYPVISDPTIQICNSLEVENLGSLTIASDGMLTVSTDLTNSGTLTLQSNIAGTGSLIESSGPEATIQKFITGSNTSNIPDGRFWYLTTPISNGKSEIFNAIGNNKLWYFTEESGTYTEILDNVTDLIAGRGYVARVTSNTTLNFAGNINHDTIVLNTSWNAPSVSPGFNLVGNPYPSGINWGSVEKSNLRTTFWYRTHSGSAMVFDSFNSFSGIGTNNNGNGEISGTVPAMQTFWVRTENNNASGQIIFSNSDRVHTSPNNLFKNIQNPDNVLRIRVERGVFTDETIICFFENATLGFDDYDSEKLYPTDQNLPQIYTTDSLAGDLSIKSLPNNFSNLTIPLGFLIEISDQFSINAYNITDLDPNIEIYLEDLDQNTFSNLRQNPLYSFSSTASNTMRFVLHFSLLVTETKDNISYIRSKIYSHKNSIYIKTQAENYYVEIYDMLGKKIMQRSYSNSTITKIDLNNTRGNYFVRMVENNKITSQKVFLN